MARRRRYNILLTRPDEKGGEMHLIGTGTFGPEPGQFTISIPLRKRLNFLLDLARVTAFDVMMERPRALWGSGGGGLIGYFVAWLMSHFVEVPLLRFEQATEDPTQRRAKIAVIGAYQSYHRKRTRELALELANELTSRGYVGMMPDLTDDGRWKHPVAVTLAGIVLVVILTCAILSICVALGVFAGD